MASYCDGAAAASGRRGGIVEKLLGKYCAKEKTVVVEKEKKLGAATVCGVSLKWFIGFCEMEMRGMKIGDLLKKVKEITSFEQSMVEWLKGKGTQSNETTLLVNEIADIYVSYSAECSVHDMVTSLKTLFPSGENGKENKDDLFIWIDVLMMNQSEMEQETKEWMKMIERVMNKIGRIVIILMPWNNPINLSRSWCVWELHCARMNENTKMEIVIVPSQRDAFREALRTSAKNLVAGIGKIEVETAQSLGKSNHCIIIDAIRASKGGIEAVRESVVDPIRKWMTKEAIALIDELEQREDDLDEISLMCNRVDVLLGEQGLFDIQERYSRKAVKLRKQLHGDEHPNVATNLNNLANLLKAQGKYEEAAPLYREALLIDRKVFGNENPEVATSLNNLATLLQDQGKYEDAEPLYREALAIDQKALGNDHADVGIDLNNLALLLQDQGKYREAESLLREALLINMNALGCDHPNVAINLSNLAMLFQDMNCFSEAECCIRVGLSIDKNTFGNDHPNTAIHISYLALILKYAGRLNEAEMVHNEAYKIAKKVFPEVHPRIAFLFRIKAEISLGMNRVEDAGSYIHKALEMYKVVHRMTPDHKDIAESLLVLAKILNANGDDTAELMGRESLQMYERTLGPNHPKTNKARVTIEHLTVF